MTSQTTYFLLSRPGPHIVHVEINRPSKLNAFCETMRFELRDTFDKLSRDSSVRAIVLSGAGERAFTAGLDVQAAAESGELTSPEGSDPARKAATIRRHIEDFQGCISALERCENRMYYTFPSLIETFGPSGVPANRYVSAVICVMHGYSLGLAIDLSSCADIRICA